MLIVATSECEWWIGESVEACVNAASDYSGIPVDDDEFDDAFALNDEQLNRLKFVDTDEDERQVGEARTFREEMALQIAAGGEFPRLFACTEY